MTNSIAEVVFKERSRATALLLLARLLDTVLKCPATLITFDYGKPGMFSSVDYASNCSAPDMIATCEHFLEHWNIKRARVFEGPPTLKLPQVAELMEIADWLKHNIEPDRGFALLVGVGAESNYISSAVRADIVTLMQDELLPRWRNKVN